MYITKGLLEFLCGIVFEYNCLWFGRVHVVIIVMIGPTTYNPLASHPLRSHPVQGCKAQGLWSAV